MVMAIAIRAYGKLIPYMHCARYSIRSTNCGTLTPKASCFPALFIARTSIAPVAITSIILLPPMLGTAASCNHAYGIVGNPSCSCLNLIYVFLERICDFCLVLIPTTYELMICNSPYHADSAKCV
jgi:hypothetical protein